MQRLEISCAVRRIYMSLGAKGLRKVSVPCSEFSGTCFVLEWGWGKDRRSDACKVPRRDSLDPDIVQGVPQREQ
jgi:hypothetical protein